MPNNVHFNDKSAEGVRNLLLSPITLNTIPRGNYPLHSIYYCKRYLKIPAASSALVEKYKRHIDLDLLRTMPNNVNFNDKAAEGVRIIQPSPFYSEHFSKG